MQLLSLAVAQSRMRLATPLAGTSRGRIVIEARVTIQNHHRLRIAALIVMHPYSVPPNKNMSNSSRHAHRATSPYAYAACRIVEPCRSRLYGTPMPTLSPEPLLVFRTSGHSPWQGLQGEQRWNHSSRYPRWRSSSRPHVFSEARCS